MHYYTCHAYFSVRKLATRALPSTVTAGPQIQISDYSENGPFEEPKLHDRRIPNTASHIIPTIRRSQVVSDATTKRNPHRLPRHEYKDLDDLLRQFAIKHAQDRVRHFWSPPILEGIMTPDRIADELMSTMAPQSISIVRTTHPATGTRDPLKLSENLCHSRPHRKGRMYYRFLSANR